MNPVVKELFKYVLAILFIVLGLLFASMYLGASEVEAQPKGMLVGSLFLTITGILILPIVSEKITGMLAKVLTVVGLLASLFLAYSVYNSVDGEMDYQVRQEQYDKACMQRLVDIRDAEEAYIDYHGHYTRDFEELKRFVLEPTVPLPFRSGGFHDTIGGVQEYNTLGLIIKRSEVDSVAAMMGYSPKDFEEMISKDQTIYKILDTSYVSFQEVAFSDKERLRKKLPMVSLDSLPYSPAGFKFVIDTSSIYIGGLRAPTILVKDPKPYGRDHKYLRRDTLMFGSLTEAHTDGNWRD